MRGYLWATGSLLLVSVAQLSLKYAMTALPALTDPLAFLYALPSHWLAALLLLGGLLGYALSMLCWFLTLRYLPLSKAYPLLSLSYVLVYLAACLLPWLGESFSTGKNIGVLLILFGLWLLNGRRRGR